MYSIKQPNFIIFGKNSVDEFNFPQNFLIITSKGAKSRGWLEHFKSKKFYVFDKIEPNPSSETIDEIISDFSNSNFSHIIGMGGGLDSARFKYRLAEAMECPASDIDGMVIGGHSDK